MNTIPDKSWLMDKLDEYEKEINTLNKVMHTASDDCDKCKQRGFKKALSIATKTLEWYGDKLIYTNEKQYLEPVDITGKKARDTITEINNILGDE